MEANQESNLFLEKIHKLKRLRKNINNTQQPSPTHMSSTASPPWVTNQSKDIAHQEPATAQNVFKRNNYVIIPDQQPQVPSKTKAVRNKSKSPQNIIPQSDPQKARKPLQGGQNSFDAQILICNESLKNGSQNSFEQIQAQNLNNKSQSQYNANRPNGTRTTDQQRVTNGPVFNQMHGQYSVSNQPRTNYPIAGLMEGVHYLSQGAKTTTKTTPISHTRSPTNNSYIYLTNGQLMKQPDKRSRNTFQSKTTNNGSNSNFLTQKDKDDILDFYLEQSMQMRELSRDQNISQASKKQVEKLIGKDPERQLSPCIVLKSAQNFRMMQKGIYQIEKQNNNQKPSQKIRSRQNRLKTAAKKLARTQHNSPLMIGQNGDLVIGYNGDLIPQNLVQYTNKCLETKLSHQNLNNATNNTKQQLQMENSNIQLDQEVKIVDMAFNSSSMGTDYVDSPPKGTPKVFTGSQSFVLKQQPDIVQEGEFTKEQEIQIQMILKQLEEKVKDRLRQQNMSPKQKTPLIGQISSHQRIVSAKKWRDSVLESVPSLTLNSGQGSISQETKEKNRTGIDTAKCKTRIDPQGIILPIQNKYVDKIKRNKSSRSAMKSPNSIKKSLVTDINIDENTKLQLTIPSNNDQKQTQHQQRVQTPQGSQKMQHNDKSTSKTLNVRDTRAILEKAIQSQMRQQKLKKDQIKRIHSVLSGATLTLIRSAAAQKGDKKKQEPDRSYRTQNTQKTAKTFVTRVQKVEPFIKANQNSRTPPLLKQAQETTLSQYDIISDNISINIKQLNEDLNKKENEDLKQVNVMESGGPRKQIGPRKVQTSNNSLELNFKMNTEVYNKNDTPTEIRPKDKRPNWQNRQSSFNDVLLAQRKDTSKNLLPAPSCMGVKHMLDQIPEDSPDALSPILAVKPGDQTGGFSKSRLTGTTEILPGNAKIQFSPECQSPTMKQLLVVQHQKYGSMNNKIEKKDVKVMSPIEFGLDLQIQGDQSDKTTAKLVESQNILPVKVRKMPYGGPTSFSGSAVKLSGEQSKNSNRLQLSQQISFSNNSTMGPQVNQFGSINSPNQSLQKLKEIKLQDQPIPQPIFEMEEHKEYSSKVVTQNISPSTKHVRFNSKKYSKSKTKQSDIIVGNLFSDIKEMQDDDKSEMTQMQLDVLKEHADSLCGKYTYLNLLSQSSESVTLNENTNESIINTKPKSQRSSLSKLQLKKQAGPYQDIPSILRKSTGHKS